MNSPRTGFDRWQVRPYLKVKLGTCATEAHLEDVYGVLRSVRIRIFSDPAHIHYFDQDSIGGRQIWHRDGHRPQAADLKSAWNRTVVPRVTIPLFSLGRVSFLLTS